jgi:hypothetical protein
MRQSAGGGRRRQLLAGDGGQKIVGPLGTGYDVREALRSKEGSSLRSIEDGR